MQELSKDLGILVQKAIQFQEKMTPSATNKLFQRWRNLNPDENINAYINLGIEITKLQNVYDREITTFYETLNKFISKNVSQMHNLTCLNYLTLARTSYENNYKLLNQIYEQVDVQEEEIDFNFLKYSADLQCDNLKFVSRLIDALHHDVTETQFNQYLYSLFVLFPNEQSDVLLHLIRDKKYRQFTPGNYLLYSNLCQSKNIKPPEQFELIDQNVKFRIVEQSHLQQEIEILLNMINLKYEQEKMVDDMYQVDFYLPQDNQILEVNGPYHYIYDLDEEENPRIFTGKHYYKQMCLGALGYDVRNMCYADYYDARGTSGRLKLLKSVLE